jgi:hypothetical protein
MRNRFSLAPTPIFASHFKIQARMVATFELVENFRLRDEAELVL